MGRATSGQEESKKRLQHVQRSQMAKNVVPLGKFSTHHFTSSRLFFEKVRISYAIDSVCLDLHCILAAFY